MGNKVKLTCVDNQEPKQISDKRMLFLPTEVTL